MQRLCAVVVCSVLSTTGQVYALGTDYPTPAEEILMPTVVLECKFQLYANEAYKLMHSVGRTYTEGYIARLVAWGMCTEGWRSVPESMLVICQGFDWRCASIEIEGGSFGVIFPSIIK